VTKNNVNEIIMSIGTKSYSASRLGVLSVIMCSTFAVHLLKINKHAVVLAKLSMVRVLLKNVSGLSYSTKLSR
jgi:hypothetical protein